MRRQRQHGFALVILLIIVGAASGALAAGLSKRIKPPVTGLRRIAEARLAALVAGAAEYYHRYGTFPGTIAGAISTAPVDDGAEMTVDPYAPANAGTTAFYYSVTGVTPKTVVVRSVGPDGVLGSADDLECRAAEDGSGRSRSRNRLRLVRAKYYLYVAGQYPMGWLLGQTASKARLRVLMRDLALAERKLWYLRTVSRSAVVAEITAKQSDIDLELLLNGVVLPLLSSVVGPGGLMSKLGLPDSLAGDGFNAQLKLDTRLGVVSGGGDRVLGTDDDF